MIMRATALTIMASFSLLLLGASQSSRISASLRHHPEYLEDGDRSGLRFHFRNSPTSRKYLIEAMGGGVAIFDYDNDGWPDVFFVNGAALKDPQPNGQALDK